MTRHGILAALFTLCVFSLTLYTACSKDKCKDVNCNAGTCNDGRCSCPTGYSGTNCENDFCASTNCNTGSCVNGRCVCPAGYTGPYCDTLAIRKYLGRYRVTQTCNNQTTTNVCNITTTNNVNLKIEGFSGINNLIVYGAPTANSDLFTIGSTNEATTTLTGTGSFVNDTIYVNYTLNRASETQNCGAVWVKMIQ